MNTAGWPIFGINLVSAADFVRFWDGLYDDEGYDESFYRDNIGRAPAAKAYEWFKWKNGTPLSARKQQTVQAILSDGEPVGPDADAGALRSYLGQTGGSSGGSSGCTYTTPSTSRSTTSTFTGRWRV
jgi:hypothetical protein